MDSVCAGMVEGGGGGDGMRCGVWRAEGVWQKNEVETRRGRQLMEDSLMWRRWILSGGK